MCNEVVMKKIFLISLVLIFVLIGCTGDLNDEKVTKVDFGSVVEKPNGSFKGEISDVLKVAVSTMISPKETFDYYEKLFQYLGERTGKKVVFKQRKTYKEVNQLIENHKIDFAFVCSGAFVFDYKTIPMEILAVPFVKGEPYYQAYIIVHKDSPYKSFEDLKGASFAFTDPLSNSGYMYAVYRLNQMGTTPENFFSKTIFTYAHDYSIQAVAKKITEGATIDGLIYDYQEIDNPQVVENIRVIEKSQKFGIPPIVIHKEAPVDLKREIRNILFSMHLDSTGKEILEGLHIDRFGPGDIHLYEGLKKIVESAQTQ